MQTRALVAIGVLGAVSYLGFGAQVYAQSSYYQGKSSRTSAKVRPSKKCPTESSIIFATMR